MNLKNILDVSSERYSRASKKAYSLGRNSQGNKFAKAAGDALTRELRALRFNLKNREDVSLLKSVGISTSALKSADTDGDNIVTVQDLQSSPQVAEVDVTNLIDILSEDPVVTKNYDVNESHETIELDEDDDSVFLTNDIIPLTDDLAVAFLAPYDISIFFNLTNNIVIDYYFGAHSKSYFEKECLPLEFDNIRDNCCVVAADRKDYANIVKKLVGFSDTSHDIALYVEDDEPDTHFVHYFDGEGCYISRRTNYPYTFETVRASNNVDYTVVYSVDLFSFVDILPATESLEKIAESVEYFEKKLKISKIYPLFDFNIDVAEVVNLPVKEGLKLIKETNPDK